MNKSKRHNLIRKIINNNKISRQDDLVRALNQSGVEVTQATISRDIKELQLMKIPSGNGEYIYAFPKNNLSQIEQRFFNLLRRSMVTIRVQDKFLFIDLKPGNGASVSATLKQVRYGFVFASISDDSGVLIICQSHEDAQTFKNRITQAIAFS